MKLFPIRATLGGFLLVCAAGCDGDDSEPASNAPPCTIAEAADSLPEGGVHLDIESGPRLIVNLVIGGATVRVLLDTGSAGLRVLASALDGGVEATDAAVSYAYHDNNLVLNGFVTRSPVTVGDRTTPPIPLMVVTAACRYPTGTVCGAGSGTPAADVFGFDGVLGVSMQINATDQGVDSPFAQLTDHPAFVVHLASSSTDSSRIVFGNADALSAEFAVVSLPVYEAGVATPFPSWVNRGINSIVQDTSTGASYALPASIDTGNPGPYIEWPTPASSPSPGDAVTVSVGVGGACLPGSYSFTVGAAPATFDVEQSNAGFMNLGIAPLYYYDVLFDPWHGLVGLRPR